MVYYRLLFAYMLIYCLHAICLHPILPTCYWKKKLTNLVYLKNLSCTVALVDATLQNIVISYNSVLAKKSIAIKPIGIQRSHI